MRCAVCGSDNPEEFRYCGSCGSELARWCPNCGAGIRPSDGFCGSCGRAVDGAASDPLIGVAGERRRVTVLFADLVGFSTLAELMDPEELHGVTTETLGELAALIEAREGTVEKFIGDAVMAVFGAPRAHEDDPERAVEVALEMIRAVQHRTGPVSTQLQLRVGINSGLVVAGGVGDGTQTGVMGDAVNVAARLQQVAGPNEVLVSAVVWRRVRHRFEGLPVGPLEVKGREQPVEAYRVTGVQETADRTVAPFIGRRDELSLLELLWSSAAKGNTHVVSLVGGPGVGKSRLLSELQSRENALDFRIVCTAQRAYGPFHELVEGILGHRAGDVADLRSLMTGIAGVDEEVVLLMAALLGLAGGPPVVGMADEHRKRQVFSGMWRFLLAVHEARPGLLILDDLQWADRSTLDLLGFLLERLWGIPLMIVLAYRPEFRIEWATLRASHTGIHLDVLTDEQSLELARGYLGVSEIPEELDRLIVSRCEGNAFFVEELLHALLDLGSLEVAGGRARLGAVPAEVPDTIEGTVLSRVDRLAHRDRLTLQYAAVIGRTFPTDLLTTVRGDDDVGSSLEELSRLQLVVRQGPELWAFRHALIQEVVYDTLLLRHRTELHRKVAEVLEVKATADTGVLVLLAEHYAQAGIRDKARRYALAAGDAAGERMGFVEARNRYAAALRLWGEGDQEGRLGLLMKHGWAALLSGDPASARTSMIEAEAGYRALGDLHRAGTALATLGRVYFFTGEMEQSAESLAGAIRMLESEGPSSDLARAYVWISILHSVTGEVDACREVATKGLAIADAVGLEVARSHLLTSLGLSEALSGDRAGIDRIHQALGIAERSGEAEAIGRAYLNVAVARCELFELADGVEQCRRGREVMHRLGAPSFEWVIATREARMLVDQARFEEAEQLCREMLGPNRTVLVAPAVVFAGLALSEALFRQGRYDEARLAIDELLPGARRIGGGMFLAPALTAQAEVEEARGNGAAARQAIAEAVTVVADAPSTVYPFVPLVPAARILGAQEVRPMLERERNGAGRHPSLQARLWEAEGILSANKTLLTKAADAYASLRLPYQEARARIAAGGLAQASIIVEEHGLQEGPLGAALSKTDEQASTP
jgi:adenylate cyclase